ncbi:MAG TPA: DNA ligase D, partial [Thermoanaerobaculia bacterium]|nr:DNA ligase D [Thermoanaerobaculia bacterium]
SPGAPVFVVHKHAARRLHYDLRLEMSGVLRSWAVPKGPSYDPDEKRFAAETEDHPLPYGDFEGVIPSGSYGAGPSIVWDRGVFVPAEEPEESYRRGKLLFTLKGYKLKGQWELIRLKADKEWLLFKKKDSFASKKAADFDEASVLSGLTVEELGSAADRARALVADAKRAGAAARRVTARDAAPMLAETREAPFSRAGWLFEPKLDGYRAIAGAEDRRASLIYRGGGDAAETFPEVARALASLPFSSVVLDGELVVCDEKGKPSFQRLQRRGQLGSRADRARAAAETPATLFVFDVLGLEDLDLRPLPLHERKRLLARIVPKSGPLRLVEGLPDRGEELFAAAVELGFEGIVAKDLEAPYRAGRSERWLKVRADRTDDFVVVGYTLPKEMRVGFGALHLGSYVEGELVYAGRVGSGFSEALLARVFGVLASTAVKKPLCAGALPAGREHRWTEPRLVCEVRFKERTEGGLLRQSVFLRLREEKRPEECVTLVRRSPRGHEGEETRETPRLQLSRLEKVFWPEDGTTKGDLIDYYRRVAPFLLPYLADRPLVLTRYPDGIHGKSFFQKDAPSFAPEWLRTARVFSEETARELDYFVCDTVEALLYVINLGAIPLHVFASRTRSLPLPDWCILDLDPKTAPFRDVVTIALALHELCEEIGLPSFVKTSGSTGLHVLVPLATRLGYAECRSLAELLARVIVLRLPEIATMVRNPAARGGRVYVDTLQNGHGKLLVSPFSVRPLPGAPVSTPLEWREVNARLDIRKLTIETVPKRLAKAKSDPLLPVLTAVPDLA